MFKPTVDYYFNKNKVDKQFRGLWVESCHGKKVKHDNRLTGTIGPYIILEKWCDTNKPSIITRIKAFFSNIFK